MSPPVSSFRSWRRGRVCPLVPNPRDTALNIIPTSTLTHPPKDRATVFHNRKQRLPLDAYRVAGSTWHVTTNVASRNGEPVSQPGRRDLTTSIFFYADARFAMPCPILICLIPDHLHLLVEIRSVGLVDLMRRTKSSSTKL